MSTQNGQTQKGMLRVALPSNDRIMNDTLQFLDRCGVRADRISGRSYQTTFAGVPHSTGLFQRSTDITSKVEEGSVDIAILGLDAFTEARTDGSDAITIIDDLGYSRCELVLAVPDSWIDVSSIFDLADLSASMRESGHDLRVATKYPRLVRRFLYSKGLNYFNIVGAGGTLEAAPLMGYADIIADITETGTTMRENHLKQISGGTVLKSHAVLIGNRRTLHEDPARLEGARVLLEMIEAYRRAGQYYLVRANIQGSSEEAVARSVTRDALVAGMQGPTIAPVHSKMGGEEGWYNVAVVVEKKNLLGAVDHLRVVGASGVTATPISYVFRKESEAFSRLMDSAPNTQ